MSRLQIIHYQSYSLHIATSIKLAQPQEQCHHTIATWFGLFVFKDTPVTASEGLVGVPSHIPGPWGLLHVTRVCQSARRVPENCESLPIKRPSGFFQKLLSHWRPKLRKSLVVKSAVFSLGRHFKPLQGQFAESLWKGSISSGNDAFSKPSQPLSLIKCPSEQHPLPQWSRETSCFLLPPNQWSLFFRDSPDAGGSSSCLG